MAFSVPLLFIGWLKGWQMSNPSLKSKGINKKIFKNKSFSKKQNKFATAWCVR